MQVDNGHGCRGATPASATGGHRRLQVGLALRLVRIAARARGGAKLQWRAFLDDTTKRLLQSLVGTIADREGDAGEGSQRWGLGRAPLHALGRKEIDHPERHCTFVEGWMDWMERRRIGSVVPCRDDPGTKLDHYSSTRRDRPSRVDGKIAQRLGRSRANEQLRRRR